MSERSSTYFKSNHTAWTDLILDHFDSRLSMFIFCLDEFLVLFACTPRGPVFDSVPAVGATCKGHYQIQNFSLYNLGGSI